MNKYLWLDIVRAIAVSLVVYGHFIGAGMFAPEIPGVISDVSLLPILEAKELLLKPIDMLVKYFGTDIASAGVILFFITTGYLIPMMLERYSRIDFLINRIFRIFPALIIAIIVIGVFVYKTQGITFSVKSYIGSMTLTYFFIGVAPITGVLWTLTIEVLFYLIMFISGRITMKKMFIILFATSLISFITVNSWFPMAYFIRFIPVICIGMAF